MTTAAILQSARHFAQEVLHPVEPDAQTGSTNQREVHHYHHGYWGHHSYPAGCWGSPSHCSSSKNEDSSKKDNFALVVTIATIAILASSYFIGSELGRRSDVSAHRELLEDQGQMLKASKEPKEERVVQVLEIESRMLDAMQAQSTKGLMVKTGLLISGITGLAGALLSAPATITAATVGGVASLGATLIHWGYTDADSSVKEEAMRLIGAIHRAEA